MIYWLLTALLFCFLVIAYHNDFIIKSLKYALPYQQCGGSTLYAKEWIRGFYCKSPYSLPALGVGVGGICVPTN